ncbi:DNA-directed RNA polymerase, insert domain containing protein [Rhypophila sp. PSN 637]
MKPSKEELERRNIVGVGAERVTNVTSTDYPGHFPGEDHAWDLSHFRDNVTIEFHKNEPLEAEFSLIGVDASIANAFRRMMIADVPTFAIETVHMEKNTSVIQDEVLSHRLGLVPFKGGKTGFRKFMKFYKKPEEGEEHAYVDFNTIQLSLNVECTHNKKAAKNETVVTKLYNHAHVYASDIEFNPVGRQEQYFSGDNAIVPVHPDILIAKLRPGQQINCSLLMHKGVGSDHAKFSPVATASYRLMPTIKIKSPILGDDAKKFQKCFPKGVIELQTVTRKESKEEGPLKGKEGEWKAVVVDPMRDTVSRECLRHDEFKDKVELGRKRDHFIYSVESTGQWRSDEIFLEAVALFKEKAKKFEHQVINMAR